jgi:endonuclease/exonuclease/phosphatase family metal-dependent hydrolase
MLTFVLSMKARLILFISFFTFEIGFCQSMQSPPPPEKIKILSWNIYMLPGIVKAKGKGARATAIGEKLKDSDYDVIVFQEAFLRKARKIIFSQLKEKFPYQTGPANQKLISCKTNSGIWIFSKHPIVSSHSIIFKNKSGIDAFSRKGGLIAEVMIDKTLIQIAGTHLQNSGQAWIRQSQCVEFYNRLLKPFYKKEVPQVVCGDFNINREREEEYSFMLQTLHVTDGQLNGAQQHTYDRSQNDLHVEPGDQKDLIDYILIRDQANQLASTDRQIKMIRKNWDNTHADLSDHFALEAEIKFAYPTLFSKSKEAVSLLNK